MNWEAYSLQGGEYTSPKKRKTWSWKRFGSISVGVSLFAALFMGGCASPGPPKPPSLHLPALATGISARRVGDQVLLGWTSPSETSDGLPFQGKMTAEVCREVGPRPKTPVARAAACVPVRREPVSSGRSEFTDDLPAPVATGPVVLLTYRVQLFNAAGRSAGLSSEAGFAAGGVAPQAIADLRVENREAGALLEWTGSVVPQGASDAVELDRIDLTVAPASKGKSTVAPAKHKSGFGGSGASHGNAASNEADAQPENEVRLRVKVGDGAQAGTVDQSVEMGESYQYTAERVRSVTLGVHTLEIHSAVSNVVRLARVDTFPPAVPTGLAAIAGVGGAGKAYVDLSWEPNGEVDLAGYVVLRMTVDAQGKAVGESRKLNETPLSAPAFRDETAVAGETYAYRVIAVDRTGNRSAASELAQVQVVP